MNFDFSENLTVTRRSDSTSPYSLHLISLIPSRGRRRSLLAMALPVLLCFAACNPVVSRFASRAVDQMSEPTLPASHMVSTPIRSDVGCSILWAGHATVLIQIHDKVIITDPVFTTTVGLLAKRAVDAGLDPASVTQLDAVLISHIHLDHFNYSSLGQLPKTARLFVPAGGISYTPEFGFNETIPAKTWQSYEKDGLRITPVPVQHFGGRYGFDASWNREPTWTGYIIEYRGETVFFAGDTGYNPEFFKEIGRRYKIDVALIPIAPVEPRSYMSRIHTDPLEALQVFQDVGAKLMIPIHYDTFFQGLEPRGSYAKDILLKLLGERGLQDRVKMLEIGEQIVITE